MPTIIDNNYGLLGINVHVAHFIAGMSFELSGAKFIKLFTTISYELS
jgi:hypothetical protein